MKKFIGFCGSKKSYGLIFCILVLLFTKGAWAQEGVFISEIAWMGTEVSSSDEWIELYNPSESELDLAGWSLRADDGSPEISLSGMADGFGYYLLERTDDNSALDVSASQIYTGSLSNAGEALGLYDVLGNLVDYVSGWLGGDSETKETMQRADSLTEWCTAEGTAGGINSCDPSTGSGPSGGGSGTNVVIQISEVQSNGEGVDYVEVHCVECEEGVSVADISVNGKVAETEDVIQTGDKILFFFGTGETGLTGYSVGGSGISGTQGEVELVYQKETRDAVCWNPGGIMDESDEKQADLRERGVWEGACLDSDILSSNVVLARKYEGEWDIDHSTPGMTNTFANEAPVAVVTVQGSGRTTGEGALTFNPTGEDSSDPDGDSLEYLWDFGDGETSDKKNPTSRVYGVGSFDVVLTVTDPFGAQSTVTQNVLVTSSSGGGGGSVIYMTDSSQSDSYDYSDRIVINEIFPNPKGKDADGEFIELINLDSKTIDLQGWKLDDEDGGSKPYPLESRLLSKEIESLPISLTGLSLKNTSEVVRLIDPSGQVISQVLYEKAKEGESYSRSNDNEYSWSSPTAGMENIFFDEEKYSSGKVTRCIDGDTFEARFEDELVSVRLIGVDAPETKHPDKDPEYFGEEASDYLCSLLLDQEVSLIFDETKLDVYERLLAYVYLEDKLVNLQMLEDGYARLYDRFNFEKIEEFRGAETEAKSGEVGLWAREEMASKSKDKVFEKGDIRFTEFLVNPVGKDEGREYFVLKSESDVNLQDWVLEVNGKGSKFPDINLSAEIERKINSGDISFSLRNSSGVIVLIDPNGEEIDRFEYSESVNDDQVYWYDFLQNKWVTQSDYGDGSTGSPPSEEVMREPDNFSYDFSTLLFGIEVRKKYLENMTVADISRLKDGVVGVSDESYCHDVYFDTDKQTSFLLKLIYRQTGKVSFELDCFGDVCVMSRIKF